MLNAEEVKNEVVNLGELKILVETYELIAATSMRRIRASVLQNRAFHMGLSGIFRDIKQAHDRELRELIMQRKIDERSMLSIPKLHGKTVYVLFSANTGLYGDTIHKTFRYFVQEYKRKAAEVVIVGRMGVGMFEIEFPGVPYTFLEFPDDKVPVANLKQITEYLSGYRRVVAFYSVFRSLLVQQAVFSNISGEELLTEGSQKSVEKFLFEPSLQEVTLFFETEIFASLLEQIFHESRLAKLSARMVLLDRATSNIDVVLKRTVFKEQRIRHILGNRKQLNSMLGVSMWGN